MLFYTPRSQKQKKDSQVIRECLFALLGSALEESAAKILVKSTPGANPIKEI